MYSAGEVLNYGVSRGLKFIPVSSDPYHFWSRHAVFPTKPTSALQALNSQEVEQMG